jgi:hypothetical protein
MTASASKVASLKYRFLYMPPRVPSLSLKRPLSGMSVVLYLPLKRPPATGL